MFKITLINPQYRPVYVHTLLNSPNYYPTENRKFKVVIHGVYNLNKFILFC